MKAATVTAGALLGLVFVLSGVVVPFDLAPILPLAEGTPPAHFMAALAPTWSPERLASQSSRPQAPARPR